MNPHEHARQIVIQALGALTLQGIEMQAQLAVLKAQVESERTAAKGKDKKPASQEGSKPQA